MDKEKKSNRRIINGCALAVILVVGIIVIVVSVNRPTAPENEDIKQAGRAFIIQNLKDPTSPEFFHDEKIIKLSDSIYEYTEGLKAANSFGFKVPMNCHVKLKWNGKDPDEITNYTKLDFQSIYR